MNYNRNSKDSYYTVDEYGLVLADGSKHDCIGRTLQAWVAYKDDVFLFGVAQCWGAFTHRLYRHPDYAGDYNDCSRDHYIYAVIIFKLTDDLNDFKPKWRISDKFTHRPSSWLWTKAMCGSSSYPYLILIFPTIIGEVIWNPLINCIAGFHEPNQEEYLKSKPVPTKFQKFMRKLTFPTYGLYLQAWMLKVLPNSWIKRLYQWLLLKITPEHNYVIKLLLGEEVPYYYVYAYQPMTNNRWTTTLDARDDRGLELVKSDCNNVDRDFLIALYEGR